MKFQSSPPLVTVGKHDPQAEALEMRMRTLLVGKRVNAVQIVGDQCFIMLDSGESLTINCSGGFREVS